MAERNCLNGSSHTNGQSSDTQPPLKKTRQWIVSCSKEARETYNPIRAVVERIKVKPNPSLELIRLSIGDPTVFGNLPPPDTLVEALSEKLTREQHHNIVCVAGSPKARQAISSMYSTATNKVKPEVKHQCVYQGCTVNSINVRSHHQYYL